MKLNIRAYVVTGWVDGKECEDAYTSEDDAEDARAWLRKHGDFGARLEVEETTLVFDAVRD